MRSPEKGVSRDGTHAKQKGKVFGMTVDERMFLDPMSGALGLYALLREKLLVMCPDTELKVHQSQITFQARYGFAFVSLRRMKGCPAVFIIVSFGLGRRVDSPRIAAAAEPYPGRWTHHTIIGQESQLDGELMGWLREAHDFALVKGKQRRATALPVK